MQHKANSTILSSDDMTHTQCHARTVILPNTMPNGVDYLVPKSAIAGSLLEVRLRGKPLVGMLTNKASPDLDPRKLKPITALLDLPVLTPEYQQWLAFLADYSMTSPSAAWALAQPNLALKPPKRSYIPKQYIPNLSALSPTQQRAAEQIQTLLQQDAPKPLLINGVTGSGKTEVYFQAIAQILQDPIAQILVLLPEIALTYQWLARFEAAFGAKPDIWHSAITPAKRKALWRGIIGGQAQVIIGARSALALPYKNLQLIIIDEEHDTSYKQEEGVLYHARDMAIARAKFAHIPVILASATPALETLHNIAQNRYETVSLPVRHAGAKMPKITLIDMTQQSLDAGMFISPILRDQVAQTLARGEQVMLFLNRRGYAPLLLCRTCGHRFMCSDCSAWLVLHHQPKCLQCHHCGHREQAPDHCPHCEAPAEKLNPCGPGVERVQAEMLQLFPELADARALQVFSSDQLSDESVIARAVSGDIRLLIGTQMLAKGHHFPHLTLVGVVDADMGLAGGDLRATEHSYQLLEQLAGRAGRADKPGQVLLQTYAPEHPVMQALAKCAQTEQRSAFCDAELTQRKRGNWPPYGQLAAVILDGPNEQAVKQAGFHLIRSAPIDPRIRVLGPAPAPLSKLRGQYRYRLLIKADKSLNLQQTLHNWLDDASFPKLRIKIDVNPYYFL
jgi:primosomal protein N' (replication factor Y)